VPIYEYRCPNGHVFELFQRLGADPPAACELCGAGPVERVLYPVAVHFKGSGFYATDYGRGSRKKDGAPGAANDGDGGSGSGGSGSASADGGAAKSETVEGRRGVADDGRARAYGGGSRFT
jgi:putative FmdB family regulatory protein